MSYSSSYISQKKLKELFKNNTKKDNYSVYLESRKNEIYFQQNNNGIDSCFIRGPRGYRGIQGIEGIQGIQGIQGKPTDESKLDILRQELLLKTAQINNIQKSLNVLYTNFYRQPVFDISGNYTPI
jgi:hypothetical protein